MQALTRDEVRLHVQADPHTLYALVADVTRTPGWSPEVIECKWLDGATRAEVGARFVARNKRRWFTWSNRPVVVTAEPGREFAVTRTERGGGSIRWSYRFAPDLTGTTVIESYEVLDRVPGGLQWMLRILFGVRDLQADLNANMHASLARLAEIARREADLGRRSSGVT